MKSVEVVRRIGRDTALSRRVRRETIRNWTFSCRVLMPWFNFFLVTFSMPENFSLSSRVFNLNFSKSYCRKLEFNNLL